MQVENAPTRKMGNANPLDELPFTEAGAIRKYGWNAKRADGPRIEHASHLRRFLNKNVGRSWDKIYSEICNKELDSDLKVAYTWFKKHLEWAIDFDVTKVNGEIVDSKGRKVTSCGRSHFYVLNGILFVAPKEPKYVRPDKKFKQIDGRNIIKVEGIYYEFQFQDFDQTIGSIYWHRKAYDYIYKRYLTRSDAYRIYGAAIVATWKKQLNSKEIRKLKLS